MRTNVLRSKWTYCEPFSCRPDPCTPLGLSSWPSPAQVGGKRRYANRNVQAVQCCLCLLTYCYLPCSLLHAAVCGLPLPGCGGDHTPPHQHAGERTVQSPRHHTSTHTLFLRAEGTDAFVSLPAAYRQRTTVQLWTDPSLSVCFWWRSATSSPPIVPPSSPSTTVPLTRPPLCSSSLR